VQDQRTRIHIPKNWNVVPHQIVLRGFAGTPVGSDRGKFLDDERLDVRNGRFLIIGVGPDVSNVRISQADNLARVTRIGENFLISGEAGIENDFAAAPGDRSPRAALKDSPVFERKNSLPSFCFRQWILSLPPSLREFSGATAGKPAVAGLGRRRVILRIRQKPGSNRSDPPASTQKRPCRR
jgi:hypothetical protein